MKSIFIFLIALSSIYLNAAVTDQNHSPKIGIGFGSYSTGYGMSLDFTSPRLFSFNSYKEKARSSVYTYMDIGEQLVNNLSIPGSSRTSASNIVASVGLKGQVTPLESGIISPYSLLGLDIAVLDSNISTT